jgi:hypothetical protein
VAAGDAESFHRQPACPEVREHTGRCVSGDMQTWTDRSQQARWRPTGAWRGDSSIVQNGCVYNLNSRRPE